jgi:hypothetical protein
MVAFCYPQVQFLPDAFAKFEYGFFRCSEKSVLQMLSLISVNFGSELLCDLCG